MNLTITSSSKVLLVVVLAWADPSPVSPETVATSKGPGCLDSDSDSNSGGLCQCRPASGATVPVIVIRRRRIAAAGPGSLAGRRLGPAARGGSSLHGSPSLSLPVGQCESIRVYYYYY